ncbi:hypothetical protein [Pseudarthrobacter albicanus]|uniref:hypothetical protein n=1 Tax=Pseudarthrobacter albicanus TaxID=2823873 RepID=UPI001FE63B7C|nr:hypothetical protein [Pseudarthrobacter albicanus]
METVGFLMLAHRATPENLAKQARIMADADCQCVYVVDSAGALILENASEGVSALVTELGTDAQVSFHGHQNLSVGVANSVYAARAGAGNSPTEVLAAAFERLNIHTGVDIHGVMVAGSTRRRAGATGVDSVLGDGELVFASLTKEARGLGPGLARGS